MNLNTIATRNLGRNRFRTIATILGVAFAILAFVLLRTVVNAWTNGADYAARDRVVTRHKVSFIMTVPIHYVQEVAQVPGVRRAMAGTWFGGRHPIRPSEFFGTIAVQQEAFFDIYPQIEVPATQRADWLQTRDGALVGRVLAAKFGWKVGDHVKLTGTIYPGDWDFKVSGIYNSEDRSIDLAQFYFHYDYLSAGVDPRFRDQIGWVVSRADNEGQALEVAKAIDARMEVHDVQTLSQTERAMSKSYLGIFAAILKTLDLQSLALLFVNIMILGNTVAMGVRERTHEYGVLRAIGFLPRHLVGFIVGEAAAIGTIGGLLGLLVSYPIVEKGVGRFLEENMRGFFPMFRIDAWTATEALGLACLLGVLAAVIPAWRVSKLDVINALRRVG